MRNLWALDPAITYLNHGSYGACPRVVLAHQSELRAQMERRPMRFVDDELPVLLDESRRRLGELLGARTANLAFVRNATSGVNAALGSFPLLPGDEILVVDHVYNATRNAVVRRAEERGAVVRVAMLPLPVSGLDEVERLILDAVGPRTRLAVLDHVTSPTALILPIERLVPQLKARGVESLIDGAHAPGMVPLALDALGAAFYAGNCHKWLCAPKGTAFLHVRDDWRDRMRPSITSHGFNQPLERWNRYQREFDWTGTDDYTGWASLPFVLDFLATLLPGGLPALMSDNRNKVLAGRATLLEALGGTPLAPAEMIGSIAAIRLPDVTPATADLARWLRECHAIEVMFSSFPAAPHRLMRISAQAYNDADEYVRLAAILGALDWSQTLPW